MRDTKKQIRTAVIGAAVLVFCLIALLLVRTEGKENALDMQAVNSQAAANTATAEKSIQTESMTESETDQDKDQEDIFQNVGQENTENMESPAQSQMVEQITTGKENMLQSIEPKTEPEKQSLSEDDLNHEQAQLNASTYRSYINEVYRLINNERTVAGSGAVSLDDTLTVMACHRTVENAKNDWMKVEGGHHVRPNEQNASSICTYYGQNGSFGENLGRYQVSPEEIVTGWHNSQAHFNCMTNPKYTRVGIGVAQDSEGNYYWAAIFMN
ncbi:MAG: CAP domain-containing protein [Lachnospira sp.]|nr:CAP domain-containing protein [Lachnospira sp.]